MTQSTEDRFNSPFVSYAQNFEDVILYRALGHIERGYFIDVGACEPEAESVTKAFYDRGWSGINVEPMPDSFARLSAARQRDVNLNVALEAAPGVARYFSVDGGNGLSTGDAELAEAHRAEGWEIAMIDTQIRTLADVCEEFVSGPIHFLKIDVEGNEAKVIDGADFGRWRPWIHVIESTPTRNDPWEPTVLAAGYTPVLFDGLNCFFLADEHLDLRSAFELPPNLYDNIVSASEARLREDLDRVTEAVGATADGGVAEILERITALRGDRIRFESEAMTTAEPLERVAEIVGADPGENDDVVERTEALLEDRLIYGRRTGELARVVDELAHILGANADEPVELVARARALLEDRIRFETELLEGRGPDRN